MGHLRRIFRYKVFVNALFHAEVMSIFNLPIDKWYFTLPLKMVGMTRFGIKYIPELYGFQTTVLTVQTVECAEFSVKYKLS